MVLWRKGHFSLLIQLSSSNLWACNGEISFIQEYGGISLSGIAGSQVQHPRFDPTQPR